MLRCSCFLLIILFYAAKISFTAPTRAWKKKIESSSNDRSLSRDLFIIPFGICRACVCVCVSVLITFAILHTSGLLCLLSYFRQKGHGQQRERALFFVARDRVIAEAVHDILECCKHFRGISFNRFFISRQSPYIISHDYLHFRYSQVQ